MERTIHKVQGSVRIVGDTMYIGVDLLDGGREEHSYRWQIIEDHPAIPGPAVRLQRLEENGSNCDGHVYDVAMTQFGPTCTCGDFEFRRADQPPELACKHVRGCVKAGFIPGGTA